MRHQDSRDATDRARAPGHAGDAPDNPIDAPIPDLTADDTSDQPAGNPEVETDQLHSLIPGEGGGPPLRHLRIDSDDLRDLIPSANDEDR